MTGAQLPPLFQQTLTAVYRRHRQHVWLDHSIGHLERILETKGLHQRLEAPPCVCFVDLTGYTRLTEEQGDAAAAELAGRLAALVEGISAAMPAGRSAGWATAECSSAQAAPGEVLVSKPLADRIIQPGRLEPVGVVELKGVANPWRCGGAYLTQGPADDCIVRPSHGRQGCSSGGSRRRRRSARRGSPRRPSR